MCKSCVRAWALTLLLAAGCSSSLPPAADADKARSAMQTVLDAWQKGEVPQSLQKATPAIHVNDPEWSSGVKLVKYQILSDQTNGQSRRCEVLLTTEAKGGPSKEEQASYTIDTEPAIVVARD